MDQLVAMAHPRIALRADASLDIGTGHVMRCLTLADALRERGANCCFVCRAHPGNMIGMIRHRGFEALVLPLVERQAGNGDASPERSPPHADWLGADWASDAQATLTALGETPVDWLIVDHYALDAQWQAIVKPHARKLMVIDDLADRAQDCDLLLDQTFGRNATDYKSLVPSCCILLCGSQYALLRPEFAALRVYSLQRRKDTPLEQLLVAMGGIDRDNATGQVLEALKSSKLPANCRITVVMGASAPWIAEVLQQAKTMPWFAEVRINVEDMAQLMADSDLAIGAAGTASWERCSLGLPSILLVLADNQRAVAHGLERSGSVQVVQGPHELADRLPLLLNTLVSSPSQRAAMSQAASRIVDGRGIASVIHYLE